MKQGSLFGNTLDMLGNTVSFVWGDQAKEDEVLSESSEEEEDHGFENELVLEAEDGNSIRLKNSTSSFYLDRVQSFVYGGMSSRFWMLRKHINTKVKNKLFEEKVPFYAWQCITILLDNRDIDLVIPNEHHMDKFIQLLIYSAQTLNGEKGSAEALIKHLYDRKIRKLSMKKIPAYQKEKIMAEIRHHIMKKAMFQFRLLRVRCKISFIAFEKRMTITELFLTQIKKTYIYFYGEPAIFKSTNDMKQFEMALLSNFKKTIIFLAEYNLNNIPGMDAKYIINLHLTQSIREKMEKKKVTKIIVKKNGIE